MHVTPSCPQETKRTQPRINKIPKSVPLLLPLARLFIPVPTLPPIATPPLVSPAIRTFFFFLPVCPNPAKSLQPATSRTPHPVNRSIFLVPATPALLLPHDSTNTCARPLPRLACLISPSDRSFRRLLFSFTISLEWQFPLAQFYPSLPVPRRLPCRPRQRTPSPTFQLQPAVACASVYSASAARLWPREPI